MRSVLGMSELAARVVGIGARKGRQVNSKFNVCQVVNDKTFVSSKMRVACSNQRRSFCTYRLKTAPCDRRRQPVIVSTTDLIGSDQHAALKKHTNPERSVHSDHDLLEARRIFAPGPQRPGRLFERHNQTHCLIHGELFLFKKMDHRAKVFRQRVS